jgi:hypothetical protein
MTRSVQESERHGGDGVSYLFPMDGVTERENGRGGKHDPGPGVASGRRSDHPGLALSASSGVSYKSRGLKIVEG